MDAPVHRIDQAKLAAMQEKALITIVQGPAGPELHSGLNPMQIITVLSQFVETFRIMAAVEECKKQMDMRIVTPR